MQKVKINMHYLKGERDILHIPFYISKSCPASPSWLHLKYFEYTFRIFPSLSKQTVYNVFCCEHTYSGICCKIII